MNRKYKLFLIVSIITLSFFANSVFAFGFSDQGTKIYDAEILDITNEREVDLGWNDTKAIYKTFELLVLSGPDSGKNIKIDTDLPQLKIGDKVFISEIEQENLIIEDLSDLQEKSYEIISVNRVSKVLFFVFIFISVIIIFGGWQGVRSILALAGSFLAIFYILLPGILNGWDPFCSSALVSGIILFIAIFFTHGFNKESSVAFFGTIISILITGFLAFLAVSMNRLNGFSMDSSVLLNFNTGGELDFSGLLLGAIIIGVLGVLDDIAVTQAAVVTELFNSNNNLTRKQIYLKAVRVGKEHVSALVNTLVFAYTGTALPMLLLLSFYQYNFLYIINHEVFATEIIRTIVGSIGLVITVPIVTFLAVWFLKDYKPKHHNHSHGHSHSHHH